MHARVRPSRPGLRAEQSQPVPLLRRRSALLASATLLLVATGCSGGSATPQDEAAPSTTPVVVRIATNDGPDTPTGAAILAFARSVADLSDDALRVEPVWEAAGVGPDDWDQAVARTVIDGDNELGLIPARAFDVLGVDTLQPLQTPFLLTTAQRVEKVARSPLADDLMAGLDDIGLTGLGLFPEDLRRIFSYEEAMTTPADLDGRTIRAPRSDMTEAAFGAVGARVDDPSGDAWGQAVAAGTVHGVESSLAGMAGLGTEHRATTAAGNIVLFPKVNVLVVNRAAFEQLDEDHRVLLREAAVVTAAQPELALRETDAATDYCDVGGRIIEAPAADVAALTAAMSATRPPRDSARVAEITDAITDLVADLPPTEPVPTCEPTPAPASGASALGSTPGDLLLTVDTQIADNPAPSPVVTAAPPFDGCTAVQDLTADVDDSDPAQLQFTGTKQIQCADGNVTIDYRASMDVSLPGITSGTWRITASTLPSAAAGSGQLTGDASNCQTVAAASDCIRDTYTGTVTPDR